MSTEKTLPTLAEITSKVKELARKKKLDASDREALARLEKEVENVTKSNRQAAQRVTEYSEEETALADALERNVMGAKSGPERVIKTFESIMATHQPGNDELVAAQKHLDECVILSAALGKPVHQLKHFWTGIKDHKFYKQKDLTIGDVSQTVTATGWQPSFFSRDMIEKVRLALTVAGLFRRINMPQDPWRFPVEGPDAAWYLVPERGNADADVLGSPAGSQRVPSGYTQTGATNLIMSSKKIGTRTTLSAEATEDSWLAIMDIATDKIVSEGARVQDYVTMNGDTANTLDGGSFAATDPRLAWKGLRKFVEDVATAKVNNGGGLTIDISNLRLVRQLMGKYAINPRDVAWLVGPVGYIKMLSLAAGSHESPVQTLDKYGAAATILTGELARVDGIPIVVTEYMGPGQGELLNAAGQYDGVTTTFTEALLVRPQAMVFGDRRQMQLKRVDMPLTDQQVMVILQRLTFFHRYPSEPCVGSLYNIKKS